ncbi:MULTISPECIES: primosomal protein N' [Enterococcus]|uniref:Replication restart protein PriA n=1 Tax=Enterococcus sulfureus ATCC 49903 TaxID=1140003 RepID=S0PBP5_9ENTE|nr:primosomal protein N' [Enterococcus sulfureus]EOT46565.1 primosomal protein N' [Enterococcus sulfureus ATCC 49903]EOT86123.1 primosomal protein N' [Enterococcus sulfureus ATCC 49903]
MEKVAEVIVDVPTRQTDQPFTYRVSESLKDILEIGMRVEVPFGNGNRHIQGFVVGFSQKELNMELKEITRCIDLAPVLNSELLDLADYMKEKTFSFKITCLQTMLPSVMKAKYEKIIVRLKDHEQCDQQLFKGADSVLFEDATVSLKQIKQWRDQEIIDIQYLVKQQNRARTIRYVRSLVTRHNFDQFTDQIRKGAKRKVQLLDVLTRTEFQPTTFYTEQGISATVLRQAQKDGWLAFEEVEMYRDPYADRQFAQTEALTLNDEQEIAVETILAKPQHEVFLLEGITGSGKTEVYLQSIAAVLAQGKTAMMLVPEIALTPQMVERFKGRFGEAVAVLHSGLSKGEKYDEWRKIERKEAKVVVGARSAVFAPLENIGLIVVDEEHEASYKQEESPRYHARDLAIWRGNYHNCPVVLGSATPSLESRARAQKGVYHFLKLTKRGNKAALLPQVEVVDMREEMIHQGSETFSRVLQEKIRDRLLKNEQIVLLLNRRGYSSFVMCRDCGFVLPCPNCDISLTLHMDTKTMRCHYCGHEEKIPHRCPNCQSNKIRYYGTGTQKVEEELTQLFPEAAVLRMDVDTTRKKGAHEKILRDFGEKKASILLGTQMIAKGLDFPDITLVGVLNADTSLNLPDFRSGERTFQLLTQVSGRAGRADKLGEVVIQTFNPDHHAILLAQQQNYERFYQQEMFIRHETGYPPYFFTVKVVASHEKEEVAAKKMYQIHQRLQQVLSPQARMLGPTPSAILRIKNRYYYQLIIKYKQEPNLFPLLQEIMQSSQLDQKSGLFLSIDNEPLSFI